MLKFNLNDDDEEMRAGVEQVTEHSDEETPQAKPRSLHTVHSVPVEHQATNLIDLDAQTPERNTEMKDDDHETPEKNLNINIELGKATEAVPVSDIRQNEGDNTMESAPSVPLKMAAATNSTVATTGGGTATNKGQQVALFGQNKLSLGFQSLNTDFALPPDFQMIKKLGKGAYGKVMQIIHLPTGREYACKRFEYVFDDDQRARRLLREMAILKEMVHPCCNRLLCVLPPD